MQVRKLPIFMVFTMVVMSDHPQIDCSALIVYTEEVTETEDAFGILKFYSNRIVVLFIGRQSSASTLVYLTLQTNGMQCYSQ